MIRARKFFWWRVKDIWFDQTSFFQDKETDIVVLHTPQKILGRFITLKAKTLLLDLRPPLADLHAGVDTGLRWALRKAEREHVLVYRAPDAAAIESFYNFFVVFCKEHGILQPQKEEFYQYDIFLAKDGRDDTFLGGCCFLKDPEKMYYRYKHGATIHRGRENEAILWHALQCAKNEGFHFLDLGGVLPGQSADSYAQRNYEFKKKFSSTLVNDYIYIRCNRFLKFFQYIIMPFASLISRVDINSYVNKLHRKKALQ